MLWIAASAGCRCPRSSKPLRRSSDGQFPGDDADPGGLVGLDEITEVGGHRYDDQA